MKAIREIEYQYFNLEGLQALYMVHVAFLKGKAGVYLTNSCLRQLLPTHHRVNENRIEEFTGTVSHIFPRNKIDRPNNVYGLFLGATDEAYHKRDWVNLNSLPSEVEMLKQLGFKAQKMILG
jgi:hypothetical protein